MSNFIKIYQEQIVVFIIAIAYIAFPKLIGCLMIASTAYGLLYGDYIPTTNDNNWIKSSLVNIAFVLGCTMIAAVIHVNAVSLWIVFPLMLITVAERFKRFN